jgi:predicted Zn-dependent peptidase
MAPFRTNGLQIYIKIFYSKNNEKEFLMFLYFCARNQFMEYLTHILNNGIRLIHFPTRSEIAYCGLMINTGSRDETKNEHGMAHFIEHMLFKGTLRRKPWHILSRMEDVGGEINAYTTKEETCIYASFLKNEYSRAMDLISDILINSNFPVKEMNREKEVIIDEINSYKDSPGDLIFDDFEELIFPDHSIGRNILGTPESLQNFTKKEIQQFIFNHYHTSEMIFCSVGNISFKRLVWYFEKYFSNIPSNNKIIKTEKIPQYKPVSRTVKKDTWQTHYIMGTKAYDVMDERRTGLYLLNNILGGQGLSSRLNMSLREKKGLAYNVESFYNPYFDTGVLSIYFGTDKENLEKSIRVANNEMKKLRTTKLGTLQLHKAKRQIIGQIARSRESHESLLFKLGKSYFLFGKFDSLEELSRKVEAVSAEDILNIAGEIFDPDKLSTLIYQ